VAFDESGNFAFVRPFETDSTVITDRQEQINVPWALFQTSYAWNKQELMRNRNKEAYINLVKSRKVDAMKGLVNGIERAFWNGRTSATDLRRPMGITEVLPFATTGTTTGGFVAQTIRYSGGTTGTTFCGIDASTEAKWRSYVQVYSALDNAFLEQFTLACLETCFFVPNIVPKPGNDKVGPVRAVYSSGANLAKLMRLVNAKDDNYVGNDVLGRQTFMNPQGIITINGMPIMYAPAMGSTYGEFYAVDWSKLQPVVQASNWLVETDPKEKPDDHKTYVVYNDGAMNILCINRRTAGFCMHTVA
jgi:hypothetical protein